LERIEMATPDIGQRKTCTKCGEVKPTSGFYRATSGSVDGFRAQCRSCYNAVRRASADPGKNRAACRKWRGDNIEKAREADRKRYPARRAERLERARKDWRSLNPDDRAKRAAELREWKAANPDRVKAMWVRTYARNRDKIASRIRRWGRENPEARAAIRDRRRAREASAAGDYTKEDVRALLKSQGRVCFYCHATLKKFSVDHFIPLARGGSNGPSNLVLSCLPCNCRKAARMPWEWMPERFSKPPE
jgi:5-methylcytosine-specific restriction endonuclease McrA